jgi:glutamine amidotransferase
MIVIPNAGIGNVKSVANMLSRVGTQALVSDQPTDLRNAHKIVLAGVGAFDAGMQALSAGGWVEQLQEAVRVRKVPVLGICLGMQLLCKGSEEGTIPGLSWVDATVMRFDAKEFPNIKVPHMGWNTIDVKKTNDIIPVDEPDQRYYFAHSYHVVCEDGNNLVATVNYGNTVAAVIQNENVFGVQFHPEKSHRFGMHLLANFLKV